MATSIGYTKQTVQTTRTGTTGVITPTNITKKTNNDFVVDVGLAHWMKPQEIFFKVDGLKPNAFHYTFFDGKPVSAFCAGPDIVKISYNNTLANHDFAYKNGVYDTLYFSLYTANYGTEDNAIIRHRDYDILYVTDVKGSIYPDTIVVGSGRTKTSFYVEDYVKLNGQVYGATTATITLAPNSFYYGSADNSLHETFGNYANFMNSGFGCVIKIVAGTGAGQYRTITAYNKESRVATVNSAWNITPDDSSIYSMSPLYSTQSGSMCGYLHIQQQQFNTGEKLFRVTTSINNNKDADSFAEKSFASQGLLQDKAALQVSTMGFDYSTQQVSESLPNLSYVSDVTLTGNVSPGTPYVPPTYPPIVPPPIITMPPPIVTPPPEDYPPRSGTTDTYVMFDSGDISLTINNYPILMTEVGVDGNDVAWVCDTNSFIGSIVTIPIKAMRTNPTKTLTDNDILNLTFDIGGSSGSVHDNMCGFPGAVVIPPGQFPADKTYYKEYPDGTKIYPGGADPGGVFTPYDNFITTSGADVAYYYLVMDGNNDTSTPPDIQTFLRFMSTANSGGYYKKTARTKITFNRSDFVESTSGSDKTYVAKKYVHILVSSNFANLTTADVLQLPFALRMGYSARYGGITWGKYYNPDSSESNFGNVGVPQESNGKIRILANYTARWPATTGGPIVKRIYRHALSGGSSSTTTPTNPVVPGGGSTSPAANTMVQVTYPDWTKAALGYDAVYVWNKDFNKPPELYSSQASTFFVTKTFVAPRTGTANIAIAASSTGTVVVKDPLGSNIDGSYMVQLSVEGMTPTAGQWNFISGRTYTVEVTAERRPGNSGYASPAGVQVLIWDNVGNMFDLVKS